MFYLTLKQKNVDIYYHMEGIFNVTSKIFIILNSIKESKFIYVSIINPINGNKIMKLKLNLEEEMLVDFFDGFFDSGLKVEKITKKEFDDLETGDVLKFNV
jgi:hypothetical protein|tara:strand:+ start:1968 stop:2270 length:303 start_codon:yes stop_codon:yes gene_type:complete